MSIVVSAANICNLLAELQEYLEFDALPVKFGAVVRNEE